jgi:hypothetical protein
MYVEILLDICFSLDLRPVGNYKPDEMVVNLFCRA